MTILSDLTDRYVLESISSRVQTYLGWFYASETTPLVSDVWLERGNWNDFLKHLPCGDRGCCIENSYQFAR